MRVKNKMAASVSLIAGISAMALMASPAHAALTISTDATHNVTCSAGVCAATAADAVLNVTDLANLIAASPVAIKSGNQAQDIIFNAPFSWTSGNSLTLNSHRSIEIDAPFMDSGSGALTLIINAGALNFGKKGYINFLNTSNTLKINNINYVLVDSISQLASDVLANNSDSYALAKSYDAGADGIYPAAPIGELEGNFEGLGNSISNLTIRSKAKNALAGLFSDLFRGLTENLVLSKVKIQVTKHNGIAGALTALTHVNQIRHVRVTGRIEGGAQSTVGGLIGQDSQSVIEDCSANISVSAGNHSAVGGLIGLGYSLGINRYKISTSYVTGSVAGGSKSNVGGLVGYNQIKIDNSYSTAAVSGGALSNAGGLIGFNRPADAGAPFFVTTSYASGPVSGDKESFLGGFVGDDLTFGSIRGDYWDVSTSGQAAGAGNIDESGMTGLTTEEFQASLPAGFNPHVWTQKTGINNGYPYLIANPPVK